MTDGKEGLCRDSSNELPGRQRHKLLWYGSIRVNRTSIAKYESAAGVIQTCAKKAAMNVQADPKGLSSPGPKEGK